MPNETGAPSAMAETDHAMVYRHRAERLRAELVKHDLAAGVFVDPINVRYVTGSRNMQVWTLRNPARYTFVATEGPVIMFEFSGCEHLLNGLESIDEVRPAISWFYFTSGGRLSERAAAWANEIADLVRQYGAGNKRLAVDRMNPEGYESLRKFGIEVCEGQEVAERARAIKCPQEIARLQSAVRVAEAALGSVEQALSAGITENELLAILHRENIAAGGEYGETRLLTSGPRTNPWYQEAGERRIADGELLAIDTDLIGPGGYFADVSRTFLCGDGKPTGSQRDLYALAHEQVQHNMALLRPGKRFRELSELSWEMPPKYRPRRYMSLYHGAGLCGEYPYIPYPEDFPAKGYDGVIEENMTLCVESFIGSVDGGEGVKLEEMVLVTRKGPVPLSSYPFDDRLRK